MATASPPSSEWLRLSPALRRAWLALLAASRQVVGRIDDTLRAEHSLTLSEWDALVRLAFCKDPDGLRMGQLSSGIVLSQSATTRLMERLERRGFVRRTQGKQDGRETFATISKAGREMVERAAPTHYRELRALFLGALSDAECQLLAELLEKIAPPNSEQGPVPSPRPSAA